MGFDMRAPRKPGESPEAIGHGLRRRVCPERPPYDGRLSELRDYEQYILPKYVSEPRLLVFANLVELYN